MENSKIYTSYNKTIFKDSNTIILVSGFHCWKAANVREYSLDKLLAMK